MMTCLLSLFFLLAVTIEVCVPADVLVDCHNCDSDHNPFPGCLAEVQTCHADEVCRIDYGTGLPTSQCQKAQECTDHTAGSLTLCLGGGSEIGPNNCVMCCANSDCVVEISQTLQVQFPHDDLLMCPEHCPENDLTACFATIKDCNADQFCEVKREHGEVRGHCKALHEYQHCTEELVNQPCIPNDTHACFSDCCLTNACLIPHFGDLTLPMAGR